MTSFDAILYGVIQGITEFLPVSSSGHLALLPKFLHIQDPGVIFDLSMHIGTAFAVMVYFKKDLLQMFFKNRRNFLINQIVATVVSVIFILILKDFSKLYGRGHIFISVNLAFFGLLMIFADKLATKNDTDFMSEEKQFKKSSLIGLFQALAVFPGVSRSGATLTISRFLGLSRYEAGRFSFLLSLPIIFAGFIYKFMKMDGTERFEMNSLFIGVVVSFIVGLITIHYFLKFIQRAGFMWFGVYRIILALVILLLY